MTAALEERSLRVSYPGAYNASALAALHLGSVYTGSTGRESAEEMTCVYTAIDTMANERCLAGVGC